MSDTSAVYESSDSNKVLEQYDISIKKNQNCEKIMKALSIFAFIGFIAGAVASGVVTDLLARGIINLSMVRKVGVLVGAFSFTGILAAMLVTFFIIGKCAAINKKLNMEEKKYKEHLEDDDNKIEALEKEVDRLKETCKEQARNFDFYREEIDSQSKIIHTQRGTRDILEKKVRLQEKTMEKQAERIRELMGKLLAMKSNGSQDPESEVIIENEAKPLEEAEAEAAPVEQEGGGNSSSAIREEIEEESLVLENPANLQEDSGEDS